MSSNIRGRLQALERGSLSVLAQVVREYATDTPETFAERLATAHARADAARQRNPRCQAHVVIVDAPEDETP